MVLALFVLDDLQTDLAIVRYGCLVRFSLVVDSRGGSDEVTALCLGLGGQADIPDQGGPIRGLC